MRMIVGEKERERFKKSVVERVVAELSAAARGQKARWLEEQIEEAIYWEFKRLEESKSSKKEEAAFWSDARKRLLHDGEPVEILRDIATGYVDEIQGTFKPWVYKFTTSIFPVALGALFSSPLKRGLANMPIELPTLADNIVIAGEVELMRKLSKKATLIAAPTHYSNTDSMVIGYALHRIGLPPFNYGAGLNLFGNPVMSYFMNSLGAYKVDRKKKEALYKNTLKCYSQALIENGHHSLFFPGGTRSRSGKVERKLKLGLLGTGLDAYIENLKKGKADPDIYVFPITLNYHLTLEAETLIEDYLKEQGKSRYIIEDDEFSKPNELAKFMSRSFRYNSKIYFHICPPLDLFGNPVDENGTSLDPHGRAIDRKSYLLTDGKIEAHQQRDRQYTQELGEALCRSFAKHSRILSTNTLAASALEALKEQNQGLDVYRLLRLDRPRRVISLARLRAIAEKRIAALHRLADAGEVGMGDGMKKFDADRLIEEGLEIFSLYPAKKALRSEGGQIVTDNVGLLYYYGAKLDDYLERHPEAMKEEGE